MSLSSGAIVRTISGKPKTLQWICNKLNLINEHLDGILENSTDSKIGKSFIRYRENHFCKQHKKSYYI